MEIFGLFLTLFGFWPFWTIFRFSLIWAIVGFWLSWAFFSLAHLSLFEIFVSYGRILGFLDFVQTCNLFEIPWEFSHAAMVSVLVTFWSHSI